MKPSSNTDKKEATASLIKRLTQKQLTQEQYRQYEKFKTAEDRRLNDFYEKEKVSKNG